MKNINENYLPTTNQPLEIKANYNTAPKLTLLTPNLSLVSRPQNSISHADPLGNYFGDRRDMEKTFEITTSKASRKIDRNNTLLMKGNKPKVFSVSRTQWRTNFERLKKNGFCPVSHCNNMTSYA